MRCLEKHELFSRMKDEVLGPVRCYSPPPSHEHAASYEYSLNFCNLLLRVVQIIRLLEDSAKEVRDAAIETLAKFYAHIGQSLLVRATQYVSLLVGGVLLIDNVQNVWNGYSAIWRRRKFAART